MRTTRQSKHRHCPSRLRIETLEMRQLLTIVINEIHYDPPDKTQRAEFIELFNSGEAVLSAAHNRNAASVLRVPK